MRRFSNDLWTGIVCGYFFVFAYEGVIGVVQLIDLMVGQDQNALPALDSLAFTFVGLVVNLLDAIAGVQLMRRASYANIFATAVIFIHLVVSTGLIMHEWKLLAMAGSWLPALYNVSQMICALLVLFLLRYLRLNQAAQSAAVG